MTNDTNKQLFNFSKLDTAYVIFALSALFGMLQWTLKNEQRITLLEKEVQMKIQNQEEIKRDLKALNSKLDNALFYIYTGKKAGNSEK